jgi:phospholipase C
MTSPIEHIVVLMLENRSFDHLFAFSGIPGLHGVDTTKANPRPGGEDVPMSRSAPDVATSDAHHEFEDVRQQMYGSTAASASPTANMQGFVENSGPDVMQCVDPATIPVLTELGRQFLVCDNWFSSMPGPTWPNRFFVHAGSSGGLANSPSSLTTITSLQWSTLGFSFDNGTLYDALDRAGKTWRVYHGDHFPQVCAIDTMPSVFVGGGKQFRSFKRFASDFAGGDAASYTFIEPNYDVLSSFKNGNSQHPVGTLSAGEQLIKDVYDGVTRNPIMWSKSLLFVVYDEHGGYYDQLPPGHCTSPGDSPHNAAKAAHPPAPPFTFNNYGVRVPAVVVSPWLPPRKVSSETYDHTSIIRTVFDVFEIPGKLTSRDGAAKSLLPLLQSTLQMTTPPPLPTIFSGTPLTAATSPPTTPQPSLSIDGFTRIAAQIDHALQTLQSQPPMAQSELHDILRSTPDIRAVTKVPTSPDPKDALRYMTQVAARIDAHRIAQGEGTVK